MFRRHNCINVGLLPGHLLAAQVHKSFICLDDRSVCFSVHNVMTGYLVSMCGSGFDPTEFFLIMLKEYGAVLGVLTILNFCGETQGSFWKEA
jgi:hypothetical protein